MPDTRPFYSAADLYSLLERYGASARQAFFHFALYDIYYPFVAYGVATLALVALTRGVTGAQHRLTYVLAVPACGLVVELLEQACFLAVLALFPTRVTALAFTASFLTALKFVLLLALLSLLVGLSGWRLALLARHPPRGRS